MGSSGGGGGGGYPMSMMMGSGTPMPGLPVAGKDSNIGDPYNYGKFQNFLPEIETPTLNAATTDHPLIQNAGVNPSATGLRPYMFEYKGPNSPVGAASAGGAPAGGSSTADIQGLRDELAALTATVGAGGGGRGIPYGDPGAGFRPLPGQNWYGGPVASS